ncbi:MAG: hypothetical protein WBG46_05165 [Nonlabens sp.]
MKTTIQFVLTCFLFISFSNSSKAQASPSKCEIGDCQNGYGYYYDKENNGEIYHGFYKDGKFHGVGYRQDSKGQYFLSQFENGLPNNYTVYAEAGMMMGGMYTNGLKTGVHIGLADAGGKVQRLAITYVQGKEVGRKMYLPKKSTTTCLAGDCESGFGIKAEGGMLISGVFEYGDFVHGQIYNVKEGNFQMFKAPSMENMQAPYFKYEEIPTPENTRIQVAKISIGSKDNGQYIMINYEAGQMGAALFKDHQLVKKYF